MGYSTSGEFTNAERTKLTNIEALADVTDDANVGATTAVMDADFSGVKGFMEKTGAGAYDLITSQELNADIIDLIKQMHPNVSVLAAMDEATIDNILQSSDVYKLKHFTQDWINAAEYSTTSESIVEKTSRTLASDLSDVRISVQHKDGETAYPVTHWECYYKINSGDWQHLGTSGSGMVYAEKFEDIGDQVNGTVIHFGIVSLGSLYTPYIKDAQVRYDDLPLIGDILTDAIAANAAVLSFFSHLKGKYINGGSTHALPVGVEIYGNGDSYAAALNATTKFKIDVADSMIELYRTDDSEVAKSNDQTDWVLDDNATNGAFPTKTTSTHETILGEEIGCASVVMVEKSVNGAFTDTEIIIEDDDYTVDYSTRTATKIILTSAEAADIVISQSKLRITWIADVEDIDGTANTALKMKIYLNRTNTGEASPEIQKIDLGTDKYAEMQYLCG